MRLTIALPDGQRDPRAKVDVADDGDIGGGRVELTESDDERELYWMRAQGWFCCCLYRFFVLSTKLHRIIAFILLHPFKRVCSIGLDITMRFRLHYKSFIIEKKIYKYGFWHLIHLYLFNARLLCVP